MNFKSRFHIKFLVFALVSALFFTTACDDDDDGMSPNSEHFEANGVYISDGGVKVFDYFGPNLPNRDVVLGPIEINAGDNGHWDVNFYNESEQVVEGPINESDKFLVIEIKDTSVVEVWDAHNEVKQTLKTTEGWTQYQFNTGVYGVHIKGLKPNEETRMKIKVYHIDHNDFTSPEIKVRVRNQVGTNLVKLFEGTTKRTHAYLNDASVNSYYSSTFGDTLNLNTGESKSLEAKFFQATMVEKQAGYEITEGDQFTPSVPLHSLNVITNNDVIASIDQENMDTWEFKLTGESAGTCTITVQIYHDGHLGKAFHSIPVKIQ
ncbi:hypothetical protein Ctha_0046 [Chloroherpeton thalassium ATCC 35110]|uniref:Lipoprotein n=1 Tax=Chloroherpeton thalassium (strain ATCC 35110 / GB-78) TaxID=517418 RepID=B3QSC7_CHLT3|nr:hypothetical protein [Chloroherpeton thalassium]ACF12518.1 hypothetical protein Ctha_0046 [Chloroherpeton thalassium ATCC 35110]